MIEAEDEFTNEFDNEINLNSTTQFQPKVWHIPVQVGAGLLVFATIMTLLNKSEPTTAQEEMEVDNIIKWAFSNLGGAATMHGIASFQKNIWPLITKYLNQKRNINVNNYPEISVEEIRESVRAFVKDWFLNGSAAFCGFTEFSMVSAALTLLNYDTFSLLILRSINALGTTAMLSFLHSLTGAAIPAQQMLQLVAVLFMVEYSGNIADVFTNMLNGTLSPTVLKWFNVVAANTVPPVIVSAAVGATYSVAKSIFGYFGKSSSKNNEEKIPLLHRNYIEMMPINNTYNPSYEF